MACFTNTELKKIAEYLIENSKKDSVRELINKMANISNKKDDMSQKS
jgi:hypothetical protein